MNIVQLVYKKTGIKIGSVRIYFLVKKSILNNPKSALKAAQKSLQKIRVVVVGKLYNGKSSKKREDTLMEISSYSFLKRDQFVKDFGLKIDSSPSLKLRRGEGGKK